MISYLIDINAWLALAWDRHPQSSIAWNWYRSSAKIECRLAFCRFTQLGLIRLLMNRQVLADDALGPKEAFAAYDYFFGDQRVIWLEDSTAIDAAMRNSLRTYGSRPATKAVMDAYLVGVSVWHKAEIVTFDSGLARAADRSGVKSVVLRAQ